MSSSSHQLIESALLKEPTGRTPCFPLIDAAYASAFSGKTLQSVQLNPMFHAEVLTECAEKLPVDGVYINLCLQENQVIHIQDNLYLLDDALTLAIPDNDVLSIKQTEINDLSDPRIESAELFHPGMLAVYAAIPETVRNTHAIIPAITGTFSQTAFLFGVQNLLMELLDSPDTVSRSLDRRHKTVLKQAEEICSSGSRFVWLGEGLGSGSLISPEMYARFVLPYEQDLTRFFREQGVLTLLHICGDTRKALPLIAQSGCDGFDFDYPVPAEMAVKVFLPGTAVKGNINPSYFLQHNSDKLQNACYELAVQFGKTPGFIMSTGCLVPRDSVTEAFTTMRNYCD
ncbi:MAG: hypothetical protein K9L21_04110 [Spirochaetia bacterium]|nr:hypothetical protein [Spirochaetia bacterium]